MPNGELSYITLAVSDLDRSVTFYRSAFDFRLHHQDQTVVFFDLGTVRLALYPALAAETGQPIVAGGCSQSLSLNLPSAADVDRQLQQAVEHGAQLLRPASEPSWGGYRGYIADPDGFVWELVWHPNYSFQRDSDFNGK